MYIKVTVFIIVLLAIEFLYSIYKEDGIYSYNSLKTNTLTFLSGGLKSIYFPGLDPLVSVFTINYLSPHLLNIPANIFTFVICLIIFDFFYWFFHMISHRFSMLWAFHHIHHSDRKLNMSVGYRVSWLEILTVFFVTVPVLLIGFPIDMFIFVFMIVFTYSALTHSRYIKFPRFMEIIFVTPQSHSIHHDENPENQNSNFGIMFTIWDRLFSFYNGKKNLDNLVFGVKGYNTNNQTNFIRIQIDPLIEYIKYLSKCLEKGSFGK